MERSSLSPQFFKVLEIADTLDISKLINKEEIPVTFNQLMKSKAKFECILIFDETSVEIPLLISFCHYSKIKLYKVCKSDVNTVKASMKHAQMLCIPSDFVEIEFIRNSLNNAIIKDILLNFKIS
ncbi:hypothetical protein GINT2_002183 [Glugoides intestinalis]